MAWHIIWAGSWGKIILWNNNPFPWTALVCAKCSIVGIQRAGLFLVGFFLAVRFRNWTFNLERDSIPWPEVWIRNGAGWRWILDGAIKPNAKRARANTSSYYLSNRSANSHIYQYPAGMQEAVGIKAIIRVIPNKSIYVATTIL